MHGMHGCQAAAMQIRAYLPGHNACSPHDPPATCCCSSTLTNTPHMFLRCTQAQALWSFVFSLSCNLLMLVLHEIMGIMDPG